MPLISNFICESCGELHEIAFVCLQCGKPLVADVEVKPFEQIIFKLHFCEQCIGELSRTIAQTVGKQGYKQGFSDARGQWAKEHDEGEKEAEELSGKFLETIKDQQGPIPRTGYRTTDEAGNVITKGGNIQELRDRLYTADKDQEAISRDLALLNPARLTQTEQEQNVNRQIERLEDERNQALRERDHYRETVAKFKEAVELMAHGPGHLCGCEVYSTTYCEGCKLEPLCAITKEHE